MAALDGAIAKVDALLGSLDTGLTDRGAVPPLCVDPDDPWADSINPPEGVYKARLCMRTPVRAWRAKRASACALAPDG